MVRKSSTSVDANSTLQSQIKSFSDNLLLIHRHRATDPRQTLEPWEVVKARREAQRLLLHFETIAETPVDRAQRIARQFLETRSLLVVAKFGVADLLGDGEMRLEDLAEKAGAKATQLGRVMRQLVGLGIFEEVSCHVYRNNLQSDVLRRDHPRSTAFHLGLEEPLLFSQYLGESIDQKSTQTCAELATGCRDLFEYLDMPNNAKKKEQFNRVMLAVTAEIETAVIADYDWNQYANETIIDVGAGLGRFTRSLLTHYPLLSAVVFDTPAVIEKAKQLHPVLPNLSYLSGNFFEQLPPARVYFLKHVLHDWPDAECLQILCKVRESMRDGGVLLLSETVMEERPLRQQCNMDVLMMVFFREGACERSLDDYRRLLQEARFEIRKVVPTRSYHSVIEAVPLLD
ncbi:uncharacterized protein VTP21DRAFT_11722 [Calcarisporiella thermophila]|uniref:uncharacterized protein n=1 Tax=Calcarisporiella thermophila TaxID=911321 RepID=UPI003742D97C